MTSKIDEIQIPSRLKKDALYVTECQQIAKISKYFDLALMVTVALDFYFFGIHPFSIGMLLICQILFICEQKFTRAKFAVSSSLSLMSRWRLAKSAVDTAETFNESIRNWNAYLWVSEENFIVSRGKHSGEIDDEIRKLRDHVQKLMHDADNLIVYANAPAQERPRLGPAFGNTINRIYGEIIDSQLVDQKKISAAFTILIEEIEGSWVHAKLLRNQLVPEPAT